jgi:uncharacterized protein YneF (UPF0154 family)
LLKTATQRIEEQGKQKDYYIQGLPGVKYDERGAPIYGQYNPLPTYEAPNFAGGYGGGIASLPNSQTYVPPPGVVGGSAPVYQPYNTASMYSNLVPRRYEEGGTVTPPTAEEKAAAAKAAADKAAATAASQAANREAVRVQKEQQRAAGFGDAYANINAGRAYNAPAPMPPVTQPPVTGFTNTQVTDYLAANPNMSDRAIYDAMNKFGVGTSQMAAATRMPLSEVQNRFDFVDRGQSNPNLQNQRGNYTTTDIQNYLKTNPGMTDAQIGDAMLKFGVGNQQMASATGLNINDVVNRRNAVNPFNPVTRTYSSSGIPAQQGIMGNSGIASLAAGGYPRRTGQISGPGTPTSDSIPAMLSDGEFVMTEKAVRGAGKGDRRAGAKRMYALMNQLEKNAARG